VEITLTRQWWRRGRRDSERSLSRPAVRSRRRRLRPVRPTAARPHAACDVLLPV